MPYHLRNAGAAWGLHSSTEDMAKYVQWQLDGKDPAVQRMRQPLVGTAQDGEAMPWNLSYDQGQPMLVHGGGSFGMSSQAALFPAQASLCSPTTRAKARKVRLKPSPWRRAPRSEASLRAPDWIGIPLSPPLTINERSPIASMASGCAPDFRAPQELPALARVLGEHQAPTPAPRAPSYGTLPVVDRNPRLETTPEDALSDLPGPW